MSWPVSVSIMAACTKAELLALPSTQGPSSGFVAFNTYGVARPWAVRGFGGITMVQLGLSIGAANAVTTRLPTASVPPVESLIPAARVSRLNTPVALVRKAKLLPTRVKDPGVSAGRLTKIE